MSIPQQIKSPTDFIKLLKDEINFGELITEYQIGGNYARDFLTEYYDEMMNAFEKLVFTNFSEFNTITITENPNPEVNKSYKIFLDFLTNSGKYFTAKETLKSYMIKLDGFHNFLSTKVEKIDSTSKNYDSLASNPSTKLSNIFGTFLKKHLTNPGMKNLIPENNFHFQYEKDGIVSSKSDYDIIIMPGAANPHQSQERVKGFVNLLKKKEMVMNLDNIKYIIFTGRGNDVGLFNEFDYDIGEQRRSFYKDGQQLESPDRGAFSSNRFYDKCTKIDQEETIQFDQEYLATKNTLKSSSEKTKPDDMRRKGYGCLFKTEAFYMAEFFYKIIKEDPELTESDVSILVSKMRLESMALDTAANFILAPYSIAYSVKVDGDSISAVFDQDMLSDNNITKILREFHEYNIHVVSSDFHILRCAINCLQTFRSPCSNCLEDSFGQIFFYPVKADEPLVEENYFSSFYQPNYQMFFRKIECPDINFVSSDKTTISYSPSKICKNPLTLHKTYLLRMLMDHALYNNINVLRNRNFMERLMKLYGLKSFFKPITNSQISLNTLFDPTSGANNSSSRSPTASGGSRKTKKKRKKKNSQKRYHKSIKKLKKNK